VFCSISNIFARSPTPLKNTLKKPITHPKTGKNLKKAYFAPKNTPENHNVTFKVTHNMYLNYGQFSTLKSFKIKMLLLLKVP